VSENDFSVSINGNRIAIETNFKQTLGCLKKINKTNKKNKNIVAIC
jgi:hypothetical protein